MCGIFGLLNYTGFELTKELVNESFQKGMPRGPEVSILKTVMIKTLFGFHRLAINGLNEQSHQPIIIDEVALICNGEIYNYNELRDHLIDDSFQNSDDEDEFTMSTQSDCEIIIHLYIRYGIEATLNMLDGEFAFVLMDRRMANGEANLFIARDPYGVRPLFIMHPKSGMTKGNNVLGFASEQKMLIDLKTKLNIAHENDDENKYVIKPYIPGNYSHYKLPFTAITEWEFKRTVTYNTMVYSSEFTRIVSLQHDYSQIIREYLLDAIRKRVDNAERPIACLLSGGLDSSLVTSLVNEIHKKKFGKPVETFSIGLEGSNDLHYTRIAADYLETNHTQIIIEEEDFVSAIPHVIYDIESYDTTTVRASVGNWLVSKYISENSDAKVVFNGDGADELMGGYLYMRKADNGLEFHSECRRLLKEIHYFDVLRSDRSISSHGLEARTPFLDRSFVQMYLNLPIMVRFQPWRIEKYLIRDAFRPDKYKTPSGKAVLPESILSRRKEAFSDGVTSIERTTKDVINDFVTKELDALDLFSQYNETPTDEKNWVELALLIDPEMKELDAHNLPKTKEQYYYRRIFEQHYSGQGRTIPHFWMPRYVEATDSSARTLELYNE
jgi:asparagine synthase (glutamine-hydrolysing)